MSGPKGIDYVIESAEQREARERAAALVRFSHARRRREALRARCRAQGLADVAGIADPGAAATAEVIAAAVASTDAETARLEAAADAAIRAREQADLQRSVSALARAVRAALSTAAPAPTRRAGDARPEAGADAARGAASERAGEEERSRIEARLQRILARQVVADPTLTGRAEEVLRSSPARATLLLDDLSHTVDRRNAEIEKERRRARQASQAATALASQEAARASDRAFVLDAVVGTLRDLGYASVTTSTAVPDGAIVVESGQPPGYGIQARLDGEEIALRSVRLDTEIKGATDVDADQHLCAALPEVAAGLLRRGVRPGRIRSIPAGILPAPVVAVAPRPREKPADQRRRRPAERTREM